MSANTRIQWLHKKITEFSYPNAMRLSERFGISHRQAQRDVDFLRKELGAPIEYSAEHKGFYYTSDYSLPVILTSDNDETYAGAISDMFDQVEADADSSVIQLQIPYTATVEIPDKLAVLDLNKYIISKEGRNKYLCQFRNVEIFLGILIMLDADIRIIEPLWLRERMVSAAERAIKNNKD